MDGPSDNFFLSFLKIVKVNFYGLSRKNFVLGYAKHLLQEDRYAIWPQFERLQIRD